MKSRVELGELVVAAFDAAAHYSHDSRQVSRLATQAVMEVLQRVRNASTQSVLDTSRAAPMNPLFSRWAADWRDPSK